MMAGTSAPHPRSATPLRRTALIGALAASATGCAFFQTRVEMKRGNEYYNTQHYEEAAESYKRVIAINPEYREAYYNLGLAYMALYQPGSTHEKDIGYSQGAIKAFKDFLNFDPENERAKNFLVEVCQKSNNHEEAIKFFEGEHARHPDDVATIQIIGSLYSKLGNIDEALNWFQKKVDLEPNDPGGYVYIGQNCWGRSYNKMDLSFDDRFAILDRGVRALDRAIELKPDSFEAYTYKNLILREKAKFDPDPARRSEFVQQADQLLKKAMELRNAAMQQQQQAAPAESKAGAS